MNGRLVFLTLSLAANVGLAAVLVRNHAAPPARAADGLPPDFPDSIIVPQRPLANRAPSATLAKDAPFNWSQLEAQDFPGYILNLRAFGVPDRIVRNIIISEVRQIYAPRFAALHPPRPATSTRTNFWEIPVAEDSDSGTSARQLIRLSTLEREQWDLIQVLVGQDIFRRLNADSSYANLQQLRYDFLPEDKQDAVQQIDWAFTRAKASLYAGANDSPDPDAQADVARFALKEHHALATLLTPEQLDEFEVRNSDVADQMRRELGPLDPTEPEFRAIFAYRRALANAAETAGTNSPSSLDAEKVFQEKLRRATGALARTLGPDRYRQYLLLSSTNFQSLVQGGVAMDVVQEVADLKNNTTTAAHKIQADPSLTPGQQAQSLSALQVDAGKALGELLGERRAQAYINHDGGWVHDLTHSP